MDLFVTHNTDICQISVRILSTYTFTEDTSDETTNEKDRPGLTPETAARPAKEGSHASDAKKKPEFKDGKSVFVICILIEK